MPAPIQPFGLRHDEPTTLFIDGAYLYNVHRALGFDIDYKALRDHFDANCNIRAMIYYGLLRDAEEYQSARKLMDFLSYNGFRIQTKQAREITDDTGRRRIVGSVITEMAVDIAMSRDMHLVVAAGDANLTYAFETAQRHNCRITVLGTLATRGTIRPLADDLRRTADRFTEMADCAEMFGKAGQAGQERLTAPSRRQPA